MRALFCVIGNIYFAKCFCIWKLCYIFAGVTSIGSYAFYDCTSLTSVTIPNSVTSIGYSAFSGCSSLTSVTIPNSVTSIGNYAFEYCSSLTSINIPYNVRNIGSKAFTGCSSLTSIVWDARNCIDFNDGGNFQPFFGVKSQITSFILGEDVEYIPAHLCSGMSNIPSITLPNSVTSIGRQAFWYCSSLTSINIPYNVRSIGKQAFTGCSSLTSIVWDARNCIDCNDDDGPFYDVRSQITSFTFGEDVEYIPALLCYGMNNLTSVNIPNKVTRIGYWAFIDCSGLTNVTIPNNVTEIEGSVFYGCSNLRNIVWNAKNYYDESSIFIFEGINSQITSFTFGEDVEYIPAFLCCGMNNLTSVTIPNKVTRIGELAFDGCSSLPVIDNIRYADTYLVEVIDNTISTYNIKDGTKWIGDYAFSDCSSLTSITIPNSVISIERVAFYGCGELETLVLGQSIESIDNHAFRDCKRLTDIYCYAERVPDVYDDPFRGVSRKATVWVPANRLKDYQIDTYWSEFDLQPISAESANTDQVVVTPDYNSADVVWPSESNADTYELIIKDKDGKEICSLIFNSNGQLQSIAFRAPAVDSEHAPEQTQASGFRFTITGLDSGSQYSYTITAKDVAGKTLQTHTGTFYTLSTTGVDNLNQDGGTSTVRKVIEDGQVLLLLPDGKKLNLQGAEVK